MDAAHITEAYDLDRKIEERLERMNMNHGMPNGASVRDWLGTAATAARVGALYIEDVRDGTTQYHLATLDNAETQLVQALDELRTVRLELT